MIEIPNVCIDFDFLLLTTIAVVLASSAALIQAQANFIWAKWKTPAAAPECWAAFSDRIQPAAVLSYWLPSEEVLVVTPDCKALYDRETNQYRFYTDETGWYVLSACRMVSK